MKEKQIMITIGEKSLPYPQGISLEALAKEFQSPEEPILLAVVDGKLKELPKKLNHSATVSFLTRRDAAGSRAYGRTISMLLYKAVHDLTEGDPAYRVVQHFSTRDGYYFTMPDAPAPSPSFLAKVQARMEDLARQEVPICKCSLPLEEAVSIFRRQGMTDKERLMRYRRVSRVNLYFIEDYADYFYGFMLPHTGYLKDFSLALFQEGFVLSFLSGSTPQSQEETGSNKLFETQKRSHNWGRCLGISNVGELNDKIVSQGIHSVLLMQEAYQEDEIACIAQEIADRQSARFILIAGPSSSGKTTFSHRLSIQLAARGFTPHPIALDNYFKNREDTPVDEYGQKDYECLEAIDVDRFNQDMLRLLAGERVELPTFNFVSGKREYKGDFLCLGSEDLLVIEGIHGLNEALSYALPSEAKFRIYISALTQLRIDGHNRIPTTDGRLLRRIVRDARTRGNSASDTILRWDSVRRGEEKYIFPFQEQADVMFNSALIYELCALKVYAEPLLFGISREDPAYLEAHRLLKFLDYFLAVPSEEIPPTSLLREFIGGGCFRV